VMKLAEGDVGANPRSVPFRFAKSSEIDRFFNDSCIQSRVI